MSSLAKRVEPEPPIKAELSAFVESYGGMERLQRIRGISIPLQKKYPVST
jgi:hypothetical protein